jgi:Carbohydrate binding domain
VNRQCGATSMTDFNAIVGSYGFALPGNTWTKVQGTIDLTNAYGSGQGTNCQPGNVATPGVVRQALLYFNQTAGTTVPNFYIDDLVVTVTDGHNLVGNPNFEAGATSGWQNNGGGALSVTTAIYLGGTHSLVHTGRTGTSQGPRWNLPLGAARYNFTFNALHDGTMAPHDLILQPTYTCQGGSANFPASIAVASQVGANGWNTLSGTATFPPANAPAGCKLTSAAVYLQQEYGNGSCTGVECPNLYVDDVSITLVP